MLAVKIHALAVILSLLGFVTRGIWMLQDSPRLQAKWVKISPHVVDTVLLASALVASWQLFWQHGLHPDFLTVKLVGLGLYVVLGTMALKRGRTKAIRATFWGLSLLLYGYLMAVGVTMDPNPFGG